MKFPTLEFLFADRDERSRRDLERTRQVTPHPVEKGDLSESIWIDTLNCYLPERYQARRAFVIDSSGNYSQQIDVIIHDRFYTPFVFKFGGYEIVPIESVYAAFEVKQTLTIANLRYAEQKISSVRSLTPSLRSTSQVPYPKRIDLISGLLTTEHPTDGRILIENLKKFMIGASLGRLDLVCSGSKALYAADASSTHIESYPSAPISQFVLRLFSAMQSRGTVPPINIDAYLANSCRA